MRYRVECVWTATDWPQSLSITAQSLEAARDLVRRAGLRVLSIDAEGPEDRAGRSAGQTPDPNPESVRKSTRPGRAPNMRRRRGNQC